MPNPDMLKVQPDTGSIFANLNSAGVEGSMKDYCLARINGQTVTPELAKSAYMDAKTLVDAAKSVGDSDVSIGAGKTVSVDILEQLMRDIQEFAKFAASREKMTKLADKFARIIK